MGRALLITVMMDGLNTGANGPDSPVAACRRRVQLQMSCTWWMTLEEVWWEISVPDQTATRAFLCFCVPGHPHRCRQLRDQPVLRLPALARRGRPWRRVCARLRPQDGSKWVVKLAFKLLNSFFLIVMTSRIHVLSQDFLNNYWFLLYKERNLWYFTQFLSCEDSDPASSKKTLLHYKNCHFSHLTASFEAFLYFSSDVLLPPCGYYSVLHHYVKIVGLLLCISFFFFLIHL